MAEFDWTGFADAARRALAERDLSFGQAVSRWPATDKAMWHRATHGNTLMPGNLLLVCACLEIDPFAFVDEAKRRRVTRKSLVKQVVTRAVQRETRETERGHG